MIFWNIVGILRRTGCFRLSRCGIWSPILHFHAPLPFNGNAIMALDILETSGNYASSSYISSVNFKRYYSAKRDQAETVKVGKWKFQGFYSSKRLYATVWQALLFKMKIQNVLFWKLSKSYAEADDLASSRYWSSICFAQSYIPMSWNMQTCKRQELHLLKKNTKTRSHS